MPTTSRLRKVVLIDDNETTNFLNERLLNRLGVTDEVEVFVDANEGFRHVWGSANLPRPELVFVDLRMPGIDGIEFLELYRSLSPNVRAHTKLAILTTSMLPSDRARVAAYPEVDYLVKPLSREKIERLLADHFPHVELVSAVPAA